MYRGDRKTIVSTRRPRSVGIHSRQFRHFRPEESTRRRQNAKYEKV
jgi:hypothetical protein